MDEQSILGIAEIANLCNVSPAAVTNWRKRFKDFPKPVAVLKAGPVYRADEIEKWIRRKNNMDTKIIAFINLKGGVAKTTTTVGLSQVLASAYEKKVLVIDLDPQTNATTMLIGEENWLKLDEAGYTLATLFSDAITGENHFDLANTLQKSVGDIKGMTSLDLLPSSLRLIDLQDKLVTMPGGPYGTRNPVTILLRGISRILKDYDYILIDCPPNLGYITLNGLRIADGYIIPTIPDVMSTYGIPQIVTRIDGFSNEISTESDINIVPIGIVPTKVRLQALIHKRTMSQMQNRSGKKMRNTELLYPRVFETYFPESAAIAGAAEYQDFPRTLGQKWGYGGQFDVFKRFSDEFITACEGI